MSSIFNKDLFKSHIESLLNDHIEEVINEITKKAVEDATIKIKKEIAKNTGSIATQIFHIIEFHMDREKFVITVNTKDLERK